MQQPRFQEILRREFDVRRKKNARYSLRAFAALLGDDHSTLAQIMRGTRQAPPGRIRAWARKLGLSAEEASVYVAAQHLPDDASAEREQQLRHWTGEALGVVTEKAHWEIVRLLHHAEFRPDCRWIAREASVTVDQVNVALSRLLRLRLLKISASGAWTDNTRLRRRSESAFRKLALTRVREEAARAHIKLRGLLDAGTKSNFQEKRS